ncbi:hypothetical protein SA58113_1607 [Staphylococcus argenteus]|nr:hypothetical protein SA58113_1607 [Staphylococcus argenteus]
MGRVSSNCFKESMWFGVNMQMIFTEGSPQSILVEHD